MENHEASVLCFICTSEVTIICDIYIISKYSYYLIVNSMKTTKPIKSRKTPHLASGEVLLFHLITIKYPAFSLLSKER